MTKAKTGDTVEVHYTGRLDDGTEFDSSRDREPLRFTIGQGQVIRGFEDAVTGLDEGQSATSRIAAEDAYGPLREDLVVQAPRSALPPNIQPEVGMMLQLQQEGGLPVPVTVTEVTDEVVTLDANHPLAGQCLTFDIQLIRVDQA